MVMYCVELNAPIGADWGESHFHVFAETRREAWRKAIALEGDLANISNIYPIKFIG